ncbi:MAG: hypothetical protein ABEK00_03625 [Candidatus Nanohaloarchaea archaeon]
MKKLTLLTLLVIAMIGLSSALTINIDIFDFGEKENQTNKTEPQNNTDPTPGRDTTVKEQDKINPDPGNMEQDPISEEDKQGLVKRLTTVLLSFL